MFPFPPNAYPMNQIQVVEENKRQLCVFKLGVDKQRQWAWWDYAAYFAHHCSMANGMFADASCVADAIKESGLDADEVRDCMGDNHADTEHPLLAVRKHCCTC